MLLISRAYQSYNIELFLLHFLLPTRPLGTLFEDKEKGSLRVLEGVSLDNWVFRDSYWGSTWNAFFQGSSRGKRRAI